MTDLSEPTEVELSILDALPPAMRCAAFQVGRLDTSRGYRVTLDTAGSVVVQQWRPRSNLRIVARVRPTQTSEWWPESWVMESGEALTEHLTLAAALAALPIPLHTVTTMT